MEASKFHVSNSQMWSLALRYAKPIGLYPTPAASAVNHSSSSRVYVRAYTYDRDNVHGAFVAVSGP